MIHWPSRLGNITHHRLDISSFGFFSENFNCFLIRIQRIYFSGMSNLLGKDFCHVAVAATSIPYGLTGLDIQRFQNYFFVHEPF